MANQRLSAGVSVRAANERGHAQHGWLDSYHTFSFADYYDPGHMGFRSLRVINEDTVQPAGGFGTHPHKDMEILSYVIEGALKHTDSMGHESVLKPGEVQKITAGSGIMHSEYNASFREPVHFLQIWIIPKRSGLKPAYQQFSLPKVHTGKPLALIGSPQGGADVVQFNQDVLVFRGNLRRGQNCPYQIKAGRGLWVQMVAGELDLNDRALNRGDGAAIDGISEIAMAAREDAEFILFDLK